jgi:hypothetical protein
MQIVKQLSGSCHSRASLLVEQFLMLGNPHAFVSAIFWFLVPWLMQESELLIVLTGLMFAFVC